MKTSTPKITLISGLGAGDEKKFGEWRYAEAEYTLHGERSSRKPLIGQALCELIPKTRRDRGKVDRVVFLGTPKIEDMWWKSGLLERGFPQQEVGFIGTPEGKTLAEIWQICGALAAAMDAGVEAGGDEPQHFYIDVMLGFRAMPILAAAAINFAVTEWARRARKTTPRVTMLYAAWEAKGSDGAMPIWDVTDLVTLGRWNGALGGFAHHGNADELGSLAGSLGAPWAGDEGDEGDEGAAGLADALGALSRDVSSGRLQELFTKSAPAVVAQIDSEATAALVKRLPLLEPSVKWLREQVVPLCADNVVGAEGVRATLAFARLCGHMGRFSDEASALREALVTSFGQATRRVPLHEPRTKGFARQRERINGELSELWKRANEGDEKQRAAFLAGLPPSLREPIEHLKPIERVRGDLGRLGLGDGAATPKQLRASLEAGLGGLAGLIEGKPTAPAFLNLSHTPVGEWSAEQIDAVRALGCGEALDLLGEMPQVDPDAESDQIDDLARELATRAVAQGALGAFVETDASLTFALVAELQARGVKCYAATTKRVTEKQEDGSTRALSRFAKWRPYARPAAEED